MAEEKVNMCFTIEKLREVRYVSTLLIQQLNPKLRVLYINTPAELENVMFMVEKGKRS
jgi:hypothetical protein